MTDILAEIESGRKSCGRECVTCVWLKTQPPEVAAQFREAFAGPPTKYPLPAIHEAMVRRGFEFGPSAVGNHRRAKHD